MKWKAHINNLCSRANSVKAIYKGMSVFALLILMLYKIAKGLVDIPSNLLTPLNSLTNKVLSTQMRFKMCTSTCNAHCNCPVDYTT